MARRARVRQVLKACASVLTAIAAAAPALAEPPMWVIEDGGSTIYLSSTAHLLDPNIEWRTERVTGALDEASPSGARIPPSTSTGVASSSSASATCSSRS